MNSELLRLLETISNAGVDIVVQNGFVCLECRPQSLTAMMKLSDQLIEGYKAEILTLLGRGDGIIEAAEIADRLSELASAKLSCWWPKRVGSQG
jgi:hypothetical protein